jgi:hypothetical protein
LKRLYVDRIIGTQPKKKILTCPSCEKLIGFLYTYKKESRPAYKLFVGAVTRTRLSVLEK